MLKKAYVSSRFGQLHYVEQGAGDAVLLLHQTPRSWDEYRDVLPIVGAHARTIAMDTVGFGASTRGVTDPFTIDLFADAVEDLLDELDIGPLIVVGHHTGGVIGLELAARQPTRVRGLVLSGTPYVDATRRASVATAPSIDHVAVDEAGGHLATLWARRSAFYPPGRPDLLNRFIGDAMRVIDRVEEGHEAVNRYRMEDRIGLVTAPTLVVCGELDDYSLPDVPNLVSRIPNARSTVLVDTGVAAVDHRPTEFGQLIVDFLHELSTQGSAL